MKCWGYNLNGQVMLVAHFLLVESGFCLGEASFLLTPCVFEQLGDGNIFNGMVPPVSVFGLTSGVVSIALGGVRLFA